MTNQTPENQTTEFCFRPKSEKHLPIVCKVIFLLTLLCVGLFFAFKLSATFADWFNDNISHAFRATLNFLTGWIPFSTAELMLLLSPVLVVFLIIRGCRNYSKTEHDTAVFLGKIFSGICCIVILFVFTFAPGYYGETLDRKVGLERTEVSASELYQTSYLLTRELNDVSEKILFPDEKSSSIMPYSYDEMNNKLMVAFDRVNSDYVFLQNFSSGVKPIMQSKLLSYTHTTGIYSFFTGEANVNVHFPDYTIPFTAAHELAHQRGIAREDEANFIAFLVCMASEDDYIRYSGLLSIYEYVMGALYTADSGLYLSASVLLNQRAVQEEVAFATFFEKYRDNTVAKISDATNNAYLESLGNKEGSRSYNLVVDLAVAYFRPSFS